MYIQYFVNFQSEARPTLSNENLLINELIREYLTFNKFKYTESVLLAGTMVYIECLLTSILIVTLRN